MTHLVHSPVRFAAQRLDLPWPQITALADTLSDDEHSRARALAPEASRRFVTARGTLRELLGSLLGVAPAEVSIGYGPHGKPRLDNPIRFSLSHSGELVLIAVALDRELGVDIERVRSLSRSARAALEWGNTELSDAELLAAWTRREAVLKAAGTGLGGSVGDLAARFTVRALAPAPGYVGALALERTAA